MDNRDGLSPDTLLAQALGALDAATGGVVPPISPSTTFTRDEAYRLRAGFGYARDENPTYAPVEALLAALEGGRAALLFSSGMAAATAVFERLKPGDHVVAQRVMYWGLRRWLRERCEERGAALTLIDPAEPDAVARAVRPGETRIVWVETPANPTWELVDIPAAARAARASGALLAVDSTAATPLITRPLSLGADIVMHSATKYLNGHSDLTAGALVFAERGAAWERLSRWRHDAGAILGAFEAWLLLRGLRTLSLRVRRSSETALFLAESLAENPALAAVLYPGLRSHPQHELALRQMSGGFGGMLSIRLRGGREAALEAAGKMRLFLRATSLGGVESLVEHRRTIEGEESPVPEDLLRLSVGIEDRGDLLADLTQALAG